MAMRSAGCYAACHANASAAVAITDGAAPPAACEVATLVTSLSGVAKQQLLAHLQGRGQGSSGGGGMSQYLDGGELTTMSLGACTAYDSLEEHARASRGGRREVRRVVDLHAQLARLALSEWLRPLPPAAVRSIRWHRTMS